MNRNFLIGGIVLLCVIAAIVLLVITIGHNNAVKPVADASNAFMVALRDGHYDQAYAMCDPSFQRDVGGVGGLQTKIEGLHAMPVRWALDTFSGDTSQAQVSGEVTYANGRTGISTVTVSYINDVWKVHLYSYSFNPTK